MGRNKNVDVGCRGEAAQSVQTSTGSAGDDCVVTGISHRGVQPLMRSRRAVLKHDYTRQHSAPGSVPAAPPRNGLARNSQLRKITQAENLMGGRR